jgi:NADP-dependent 3-hydroxy acid dehydrogenase YdfG
MYSYDLSSRTAVVTGAASGMGAETATLLAACGARVALLARRAERLTDLVNKIIAAGGTAVAVPADVTDDASVAAAADRVSTALGRIDLLVNAAGVMLPNPIAEGRADEWTRMINTNLTGALGVTRAFLPQLRAAAAAGLPADLVNVSSIGAHLTFPGYAVYCATKAALTHLSASLRAELATESVRVTNLEPGLADTELGSHIDNPALSAELEGMFAAMQALRPQDIADLIGWLTSRPRHVNLRQVIILPTQQA